jgi:hypothetical protein
MIAGLFRKIGDILRQCGASKPAQSTQIELRPAAPRPSVVGLPSWGLALHKAVIAQSNQKNAMFNQSEMVAGYFSPIWRKIELESCHRTLGRAAINPGAT